MDASIYSYVHILVFRWTFTGPKLTIITIDKKKKGVSRWGEIRITGPLVM